MKIYLDEVDVNFRVFYKSASDGIASTLTELAAQELVFRNSYRRLVSIQAWRSEVIDLSFDVNAQEFFKEAQNDALMSHVLARQGAWRVALMSLRSCIENTLFGLYYIDHLVELAQWGEGNHKLGFAEVIQYLGAHPEFKKYTDEETGIGGIKKEYATLSKAVHGSSRLFRMTKGGVIEGLNIASLPDLGAWETREALTLINLNLILITFFKSMLQGASKVNLRKAISLVVNNTKHQAVKSNFGVTLRKLPEIP